MKYIRTALSDQETIINFLYDEQIIKVYSSRAEVIKLLTKALGEPTIKYKKSKSYWSGANWDIKFSESKKIEKILLLKKFVDSEIKIKKVKVQEKTKSKTISKNKKESIVKKNKSKTISKNKKESVVKKNKSKTISKSKKESIVNKNKDKKIKEKKSIVDLDKTKKEEISKKKIKKDTSKEIKNDKKRKLNQKTTKRKQEDITDDNKFFQISLI